MCNCVTIRAHVDDQICRVGNDLLATKRLVTPYRFGAGCTVLVFVSLFAYFLFYPHQNFAGLVPDNICQTAYWYLRGHPHLVGSIGSSAPKGGLIVLLGLTHFGSYQVLDSVWLYKAVLSLFAAGLVLIIGRIAADVARSTAAGALALVVAGGSTYVNQIFFYGSSNLFFLPVALCGLWLLSRNRDRAGILALCLALTLRFDGAALAGLAALWVGIRRRKWQPLFESLAYLAIATSFVLLMSYWVQGSWARFTAGPSTGYPVYPSLETMGQLQSVVGMLISETTVAVLLLPAVYTLVRLSWSRIYLLFLGIGTATALLFFLGIVGMEYRYIASLQTLIIALGCGGLFLLADDLGGRDEGRWGTPIIACSVVSALVLAAGAWTSVPIHPLLLIFALPAVLALAAWGDGLSARRRLLVATRVLVVAVVAGVFVGSGFKARESFSDLARADLRQPSVLDAEEFLRRSVVPAGVGLLTEDELLNYVIATAPSRLGHARSIQFFNVSPEPVRRRILAQTDYLYLSKRPNFLWNYLYFVPRQDWIGDPFREVVVSMIRTNQPGDIYGVTITPFVNSATRFVARVQSARSREQDIGQ